MIFQSILYFISPSKTPTRNYLWPHLASKILSLNFLLPEDNGPLRNTARAFTNAWKQYEAV